MIQFEITKELIEKSKQIRESDQNTQFYCSSCLIANCLENKLKAKVLVSFKSFSIPGACLYNVSLPKFAVEARIKFDNGFYDDIKLGTFEIDIPEFEQIAEPS